MTLQPVKPEEASGNKCIEENVKCIPEWIDRRIYLMLFLFYWTCQFRFTRRLVHYLSPVKYKHEGKAKVCRRLFVSPAMLMAI